jgi:4-hydroxy-tetrahydrodipicolinate reductase
VVTNVRRAVELDLPLLIGTTGWQNARTDVEGLVINGGGAALYAPALSFAGGVLIHLVRRAGELFDTDPAFDPTVSEHQHAARRDSPGGTALHIGRLLLDTISRKDLLQVGPAAGPLASNQLSIASARGGYAPGTHQVEFDGPGESLEIIHRVRDRRVYAAGAVRAALWLRGRSGFFTMDDLMEDMLREAEERRNSDGEDVL